ncbi:PorP/SprF family type IX secretion system membrane protein [Ferruginibacter sp.]|uniref:PorP/SprF family type IX secretion system membrane protein n=1 Tax=Ferruginibacter sp. TaxID=1940288 RepID=UPI0026595ED7|nr:PorP/SprF family type IX secretion system membrane protein [Ferruginibacter sp.]
MKNDVHILLCCMLVLLPFLQVTGQDIHFSQFFETPLLRNPALGGLFSGDIRLQSVYRTQWQSVTVPYQTVSLNGEYKIAVGKSADFLTAGGQILYDKAGDVAMTATHVLPALNYHKSLSDEKNMYLSLGFMGGIVQRRLDRSKMTTNSQFDGSGYNGNLATGETFNNSSYSYFDGIAGMSFNAQLGDNQDNNMYAGIAYHHFNKAAKISFYDNSNLEMKPKFVYSGGIRLSTAEQSFITIEGDYSKQGPYTELITGLMYTYKLDDSDMPKYLIHGGAVIRWRDAIIPVGKIEMKPLAISVSYDANISKLAAATTGRGGFELGISYQKFINRDNSSKEAVRCPRF